MTPLSNEAVVSDPPMIRISAFEISSSTVRLCEMSEIILRKVYRNPPTRPSSSKVLQ